MEFVCKPNMALHLNREIRPNVVLEEHICAFGQKTFLRYGRGEKLGFLEEKRDCCVNPSICSRSCKKEEGKRLGLQVQGDLR